MNANGLKLGPSALDSLLGKVSEYEPDSSKVVPIWLREPASPVHYETLEEYTEAANEYFSLCVEREMQPRLAGLALALGLPGVSSIHRLARRKPNLRWLISRCITAVAYGYEEMLTTGVSRGAIFALKHMQDFDLEEPEGAPQIPVWQDRQEVVVETKVHGVVSHEVHHGNLSPSEAYLRVIQGGEVFEVSTSGEKKALEEHPLERVSLPPVELAPEDYEQIEPTKPVESSEAK